jgi:DNA-binding MarR family transcriptional regulator
MTIKNTVWAMESKLPPVPKLLLIYFAEWADIHGDVDDPPMAEMAAFCGVTYACIKAAIEELEEVGYIHRRLSSSDRGSPVIRLNTDHT